jgi:inner membrane protein
MEPITHLLTGVCIGRAGFNRRTAYATVVAMLAAEVADIDIIWGFAGPVQELKHHRGITHTVVALPVMAGIVVGGVWVAHRWWESRRVRQQKKLQLVGAQSSLNSNADLDLGRSASSSGGNGGSSANPLRTTGVRRQPVHWGWLYLTAMVAAFSHLVLDWTNNYGLWPLYPFSSRMYAGSFMFIAEPVLWAILLLAIGMPWVLGMADREMGVRKQPFRGHRSAIVALVAMAALLYFRWEERSQASVMMSRAEVVSEPIVQMAIVPYPVNPFRWHAVVETKDFYQTAEVNTWNPDALDSIETDPQTDIIYKPAVTPAVVAAKQTFLGQVYLNWTQWAIVRDVGQQPVPALKPPSLLPGRTWTTVTFNDLRFDYSFLPGRSNPRAPLSGWVYIVDGHEEAGQGMGGSVQK